MDHVWYEQICADLRAAVDNYPSALRALCQADLAALLASDFSRLAALLPYQLADLLPVPEATCRRLGLATLALSWYANIFDDLIDGAAAPAALPGAQQALLLALSMYVELGLAATPAWADLMARALRSADAYAREIWGKAKGKRQKAKGKRQKAKGKRQKANLPDAPGTDTISCGSSPTPGVFAFCMLHSSHPTPHPTVATQDVPAPTQDLGSLRDLPMDRAAPLGFVAVAQAELAGLPAGAPLRADLPAALRALTGARQIADDAADWIDDLRAGQLNFVAAAIIDHFQANTPPEQQAELSLERLVGYQIHCEPVWGQIAAQHDALCDAAAAHLRPYAPCRLSALIARQRENGAAAFDRLRAHRAAVRAMLGLP